MARHLHQIVNPLKGYLSKANTQSHRLSKQHQSIKHQQSLPPALQLAVIRGQTQVNQTCFDYFASKHMDDDFVYFAHRKLYHDSHAITELVQHCGIIGSMEDYLVEGASKQSADYAQLCQTLYYLLVDHLYQYDEFNLHRLATLGFIQHYFPTFFPKQSQIKHSLDTLKLSLQTQLNRRFHEQVRIKESFTTEDDHADFRLMLWLKDHHPFELIHVTAKRLRSARFQAYHRVLEQLECDSLIIQPVPKTAKKKQPIKPL